MKRLLLPLLALLIPAAHATNYVECEAIRSVIMRNESQMDNAFDEIKSSFHRKKVNEKYGVETCNLLENINIWNPETPTVDECVDYRTSTTKALNNAEWNEFYKASIKAYEDINKRATNDF